MIQSEHKEEATVRLVRRTYALPRDTVEEFERAVARGQRSAVIAELMRELLQEIRRRVPVGCAVD
jgi:metal-responsive CopG/Arc/MetJ family transcriptional regulator